MKRLCPSLLSVLMSVWVALLGGALFPVRAEGVIVTVEALRYLGFETLAAGDAPRALAYAEALLKRDPGDGVALILRSKALRALGRYPEAAASGRLAFRVAPDKAGRYGAAMVTAQALASDGARTRAQVWLRRAVQEAPSDTARKIAVRDFDYVRIRNPLSFTFDLSAAPSSNVNGGSANAVSQFLGLPFVLSGDARALSGYEVAAGATVKLRRPLTETGASEFRLSAQLRHYWLSGEARAQAPAARGSDYDYAAVELGWQRRFRARGHKTDLTFGAVLGRNWYGYQPLSTYGRVTIDAARPLAPGLTGQLTLAAEVQKRDDDPRRDATVLTFGGAVQKMLPNGDRLTLSLAARRTEADSSSVAHRALLGGIGWDRARPVGPVRISGGLSFEERDYDVFPLALSGRQDLRVTARLSLTLTDVQYLGFQPVIDLTASHNWSNIGLYETREAGISFGFKSAF
jgi:tetratricopeptide (TPR) repeat protein